MPEKSCLASGPLLAFTILSKKGIAIGIANLVKLDETIASPLSRLAMFLSSSDKSCEADSIIAVLSGFISMPRIIFVLIFASISLGISDGSWVIAVKPTLNYIPSLAIVANILLPFSRMSLPKTLGASSRTIDITGLSFNRPFIL